jgi:hypothetical protein
MRNQLFAALVSRGLGLFDVFAIGALIPPAFRKHRATGQA